MPFDSLPTKHPHAAEIAILDRMAELLATPDRWCKGSTSTTDGRMCLIGAAWVACQQTSIEAYDQVIAGLSNVADGRQPSRFNDDSERTHADILNLIARARRTFEGTI